MSELKYKVGDKVRIKSIDWYNENKDSNGNVVVLSKVSRFSWCENVRTVFTKDMSKFCGKVVTIEIVWTVNYSIVEGTCIDYFTDDMIECKIEEETENWTDMSIPDDPFTVTYGSPSMNDSMNKNNIDNGIIILPEGYIFKDDNGNVINATKIVLEKKKKEYPKTYEECCEILGCKSDDFFTDFSYKGCDVEISDYEDKIDDLLQNFRKLIYCRDAYWKIAGEEMGLGKPWENGRCEVVYSICRDYDDIVKQDDDWGGAHIFEFPIREMRDAFYENFKELMDSCKELL